MNKKLHNFLFNPWTYTITGGIIVGLSIILFQEIRNNIFEFIKYIFNLILTLININIPIWIILLILLLYIISKFIWNNIKINEIPSEVKREFPSWYYDYREEVFGNILWRWEYIIHPFDKKYEIKNFSFYCPNCKCGLVDKTSYNNSLYCPKCKEYIGTFEIKDVEEVKALIEYKIQNKISKK